MYHYLDAYHADLALEMELNHMRGDGEFLAEYRRRSPSVGCPRPLIAAIVAWGIAVLTFAI